MTYPYCCVFKYLFCSSCMDKNGNNRRLKRLYDEGTDRYNRDISVERIIKQIRDMKIYLNGV